MRLALSILFMFLLSPAFAAGLGIGGSGQQGGGSGGGGGSGTVTSVDMTVPAGLTVSGNPITTSGTLVLDWSVAAAGTFLATPSSANLRGLLTDETGTGAAVFATSPTFTTPNIGAATATSVNGLTVTASTGTFTLTNGKTLSVSNTLMFTGTDGSSVAYGAGGTVAYTGNKLSVFAATSSAELATVLSDESGGGVVAFTGSKLSVFAATSSAELATVLSDESGTGVVAYTTSPVFTTPNVGVATATSVNKVAITAPATSATLTIADGKTLTASDTWTVATSSETFAGGAVITWGTRSQTITAPTTADSLADVMIGASATTQKALCLQAKASHTANMFEIQRSSDGQAQFSVNASGAIVGSSCTLSAALITTNTGAAAFRITGANGGMSIGSGGILTFATTTTGITQSAGFNRPADKIIGFTVDGTAGCSWRAAPTAPAQITANQNDYNPGGSSYWLDLNTDASRDITGLVFTAAQLDGQVHVITNVGTQNIVLKHESASSTAANRFTCSTGADITLAPNESARIRYRSTSRWLVHKQP